MDQNHQKCRIWIFTPDICPNNITKIPVLLLFIGTITLLASLAYL